MSFEVVALPQTVGSVKCNIYKRNISLCRWMSCHNPRCVICNDFDFDLTWIYHGFSDFGVWYTSKYIISWLSPAYNQWDIDPNKAIACAFFLHVHNFIHPCMYVWVFVQVKQVFDKKNDTLHLLEIGNIWLDEWSMKSCVCNDIFLYFLFIA